jgi:D-3-phosphoglycerate dehydrogenase
MKKVLISTSSFSNVDQTPLDLLKKSEFEVVWPKKNQALTKEELKYFLKDVDAVIAGTENYTANILDNSRVKIISRVGIGLDNIDFKITENLGIKVAFTPNAPTDSVAELTLAHILSLLRKTYDTSNLIKSGIWRRNIGEKLSGKTVGIIGFGRIGKKVAQLMSSFGCTLISYDINPNFTDLERLNVRPVSKEFLLENSDIVTLHIPLYSNTVNFINSKELEIMRNNSYLINTSRGQIINELALYETLNRGKLSGVALDVFKEEPYILDHHLLRSSHLNNVILSSHIGSCTNEGRYLMEMGAVNAICDFFGKRNECALFSKGNMLIEYISKPEYF